MMRYVKGLCCSAALFVLTFLYSCDSREGAAPVFRTVPEIAEIQPASPVKIKMKRTASGNYAWDLSGVDVDRVTEADRQLREYIQKREDQ